jgi:hypothetical protein
MDINLGLDFAPEEAAAARGKSSRESSLLPLSDAAETTLGKHVEESKLPPTRACVARESSACLRFNERE